MHGYLHHLHRCNVVSQATQTLQSIVTHAYHVFGVFPGTVSHRDLVLMVLRVLPGKSYRATSYHLGCCSTPSLKTSEKTFGRNVDAFLSNPSMILQHAVIHTQWVIVNADVNVVQTQLKAKQSVKA